MYEKLNITENHLQILQLFTSGYDKGIYIREVQHLLNVSPRTSQLILGDLEKKGVLESETKGKIRIYRLKINVTALNYLNLVENYKKLSLMQKNDIIREVIEKITPHIKGIAAIFGSYAKGIEKKDSDLDLFIAGEYNEREISKISKIYGILISIRACPLHKFNGLVKTDTLLREILNNHVIVLGSDLFVIGAMRENGND